MLVDFSDSGEGAYVLRVDFDSGVQFPYIVREDLDALGQGFMAFREPFEAFVDSHGCFQCTVSGLRAPNDVAFGHAPSPPANRMKTITQPKQVPSLSVALMLLSSWMA